MGPCSAIAPAATASRISGTKRAIFASVLNIRSHPGSVMMPPSTIQGSHAPEPACRAGPEPVDLDAAAGRAQARARALRPRDARDGGDPRAGRRDHAPRVLPDDRHDLT